MNKIELVRLLIESIKKGYTEQEVIDLIEETNVFEERDNFFLLTDFYKTTHWLQYPRGTSEVMSYYENREGMFPKQIFFGLQYIIKKYLVGRVAYPWMLEDAKKTIKEASGFDYFNTIGAERLVYHHKGRLPIEIRAVPEGSIVGTSNVLFTIRNTDPEMPFLTNYIEDICMWVYSTIAPATNSYYFSKLERYFGSITGAEENPYFLNDFGLRGASSLETAKKAGGGHLLIYKGSDNLPAQKWLEKYYNAPTILGSVFASEHSTTTINGEENECDTIKNWLLNKIPGAAPASLVIDSYDDIRFTKEYLGGKLKHIILERAGTTIARPDSGFPVQKSLNIIQILWDCFGGIVNGKGFKVLNVKVRVIYGDKISYTMGYEIMKNLVDNEFCISNMVFGAGGDITQNYNRDTFGTAIKCCFAVIDDKERNVAKNPKSQSSKKSKAGKLKLYRYQNGKYATITSSDSQFDSYINELKTVLYNGDLIIDYTYDQVRERFLWDRKSDNEDLGVLYTKEGVKNIKIKMEEIEH